MSTFVGQPRNDELCEQCCWRQTWRHHWRSKNWQSTNEVKFIWWQKRFVVQRLRFVLIPSRTAKTSGSFFQNPTGTGTFRCHRWSRQSPEGQSRHAKRGHGNLHPTAQQCYCPCQRLCVKHCNVDRAVRPSGDISSRRFFAAIYGGDGNFSFGWGSPDSERSGRCKINSNSRI